MEEEVRTILRQALRQPAPAGALGQRLVGRFQVVAWLDAQMPERIWVCSVTCAVIELGVSLLPYEPRKLSRQLTATAMFTEEFAGRCLAFDERAATCYASIVASCTRIGRPISVEDALMASIALVHGLTLTTRNESDFDPIAGLSVVNPWSAVS